MKILPDDELKKICFLEAYWQRLETAVSGTENFKTDYFLVKGCGNELSVLSIKKSQDWRIKMFNALMGKFIKDTVGKGAMM